MAYLGAFIVTGRASSASVVFPYVAHLKSSGRSGAVIRLEALSQGNGRMVMYLGLWFKDISFC